MKLMVIATGFALLLFLPSQQLVRPGPYITFHTQIVPIVLCLAVMYLGVPYLKVAGEDGRLATVFMLLAATFVMGLIMREMLLFWGLAYSGWWFEW
jgi:hypothetical protein